MNYIFILLALISSISCIFWFNRITKSKAYEKLTIVHLLQITLVGLLATLVCTALASLLGADFFGIVHLWYLVFTLSVPLTSVVILIKSQITQRSKVVLLALTLLAPIGIYATHIEPFWLRVDKHTLLIESLNQEIKVGVLSDLQTIEIGDYEKKAIDTLLAEKPDLILIPGDFWQMSDKEFSEKYLQFQKAMKQLSEEVDHVFVVKGDTDNIAGLKKITEGTKVRLLDNEVAEIQIKGKKVIIGGLTLNSSEFSQEKVIDNLLLNTDQDLSILLAHRPESVYMIPANNNIDLLVAGHTHGGQVSIPFWGPPMTLTTVPRKVAAGGLHTVGEQNIYVSTGVGRERHQAPQIRFGVRPSIGIINIKSFL